MCFCVPCLSIIAEQTCVFVYLVYLSLLSRHVFLCTLFICRCCADMCFCVPCLSVAVE